MLTKVDLLRHVGRFEKLQHKAEPFKRLALLFARNGYGKTTICAVLRSAVWQDSRPIDERAHLGAGGVPSASLQFDPAGTVAFNNGSWNRAAPPVLIFDAEYVRANVHAADEVTRENKRQLLQVIIGAAGVTLAEKINALDEENTTVNATLRRTEAAIKRAVPAVADVGNYVNAPVPADLHERTTSVARVAAQADRAGEISRKSALRPLALGSSAKKYPQLLPQVIGSLVEDGRDLIAEHLAKHGMEADGRPWLRFGVEHATGDDCPFCDQSLSASTVIEPMRVLFSEGYSKLADTIEEAHNAIASLAGDGPGSVAALLGQNDTLATFWSKVVELPELPSITDEELAAVSANLGWMAAALKVKAANPSAGIEVTEEQAKGWAATVEWLEQYNAEVEAANCAIEAVKPVEARPIPADVSAARLTLGKYQALKQRDTEPLKTLCAEWREATKRHAEIAAERTASQKALRTHTDATAKAYQDGVNELLEQFGVNFRLCQTKASFKGGGQPNTEYCIDINGHVLPVGESKGQAAPSFKTVLSSGDKASLALALFITQARQRTDLADLILVFDDPFNSQDAGRQFETAARLRELAGTARQVVVLSHDARFLHLVGKDADPIPTSQHQIGMTADWNGEVRPWSAQVELQEQYVRRAERIRAYASTGQHLKDCTPHALASDIRVFMEEHLDLRFPGRFPASATLGPMVDEIKNAGPSDPLHAQHQALQEINEFSRPEHHRGSQLPDPTQLRVQCRKVVKIIGSY